MRNKNIDVAYFLVLEQLDAERAQSGSGVKNEDTVAAADLDAWRVAAVTHRSRAGTGNASSDSPEPNPHGAFQHSGSPEQLRSKYYLECVVMSSRDANRKFVVKNLLQPGIIDTNKLPVHV